MQAVLDWLRVAPWWQVVPVLLLENVLIFLVVVGLGELLVKWFPRRRVAAEPLPLTNLEVVLSVVNVGSNTLITVIGWQLWKAGIIIFRDDFGPWALLDVAVLVLVMDLIMYLLHRLAHHPWLYPLFHALHHRYDNPRPLTLFVLHPVENFSFGSLWLIVVSFYTFSWFGISTYLTLNVLFGMVGHLGIEFLPGGWPRWPVVGWLAGSTFHSQHHQAPETNYGFYTTIWDNLFRTLERRYISHFGRRLSEGD